MTTYSGVDGARQGRRVGVFVSAWVVALLAACGGDEIIGPSTDPLLEPFVGTWDATVLTVRSDEDTTVVADLLENGVSYITIFESGIYQSTIAFGNVPLTEFGSMSVTETIVTLRPDNGEPVTRSYEFTGADLVRLDGPTDWDFNGDEVDDPAYLFMEMRKR